MLFHYRERAIPAYKNVLVSHSTSALDIAPTSVQKFAQRYQEATTPGRNQMLEQAIARGEDPLSNEATREEWLTACTEHIDALQETLAEYKSKLMPLVRELETTLGTTRFLGRWPNEPAPSYVGKKPGPFDPAPSIHTILESLIEAKPWEPIEQPGDGRTVHENGAVTVDTGFVRGKTISHV